jgi:hypothetical protein
VERYRSPLSGKITTIFFPWFSARRPSLKAAAAAAPEEIPTIDVDADQEEIKVEDIPF